VNEVTTAYDVRHRPIFRTIWFAPLGPVYANTPQIAGQGGIPSTAGLTTTWRYDDNLTDSNGLSNSTDPDSVYPYLTGLGLGTNAVGSAMVEINPAGEHRWTIMDGMGRVVRVVDGNGHATTTTYDVVDSGGLVDTSVTDALSHSVTQAADASGWVRVMTDQSGFLTTQAFDADGNIVQVRDPNNVGRDDTFDSRNRRLTSTDTNSAETQWGYDAGSNVTSTIDALSQTTAYTFDARERKLTTLDRLGGTTSFAYDAASNLMTITDADTHALLTSHGVTTYG
jgi:YD repeat-containing protein